MTASRPPLRIGIDGRWLSGRYPGIGRYVHNLLRALPPVAAGEELVVPVAAGDGRPRFDPAELAGCRLERIPGRAALRPRAQLAVRGLASRASLDLFHATYFPGALGVRRPTVVTIHDVIPLQLPETIPARPRRLLYRLALRRTLVSATRILTPTGAVRDQLIELLGVPPQRVVVTPEAAEARFAPPQPAAVSALAGRLGLPERYVLCLGINKPHKNLRRLLAAWAIAGRQATEHRLVLAGPVDRRFPQPARMVEELATERVVVLGSVDEADLPALLGGADVLVHPSLWEGFGLPVLEAMACGTAVACSDIPPLREVAGDAALSFDPHDVGAIAGTLQELIRDREIRAELVRRGSERACSFSWRRTAELTLEAYRDAVGPR